MYYVLKGHDLRDDVISMLMMFYPNDKYVYSDSVEDGITVVNLLDGLCCNTELYYNNSLVSKGSIIGENNGIKEIKRIIKLSIFSAVNKVLNLDMPWGILTGVRPAKLVLEMWEEGYTTDEIKYIFKNKYLVSDRKLALMLSVAKNEKQIIKNGKGKVGLYIGIPFCPTKCLYCSFTSYPLKQYSNRVDAYVEALINEIKATHKYISDYDIESIYIGGGTPTSLDVNNLDKLLNSINKYFKKPLEYTVEAGRPDTITKEKLRILKDYDVNRISINPQSLNDKTLRLIGREHTTELFYEVFDMARQEGHNNINTDIILGLPDEGEEEVTNTMEGLLRLSPESITVHTLAVKRASRLKETLEKYDMIDTHKMENLLKITDTYTKQLDMHPYYMYRQKNMVGNFENVGYCKDGYHSIYNVQIMEEKQSILALGAGGSTKLFNPQNNQVERIFNVKSVDDYINRLDEMLLRKKVGIRWI